MIKQCSKCPETYDSNRTEPKKTGYGEEVNAMFFQLRKLDLCDNCLIARIYEIRENQSDTKNNVSG